MACPFLKVDSSDDPVIAIAAKLEPKLRDAFLAAAATVKSSIKLSTLAEALQAGNIEGLLRDLDIEQKLSAAFRGEGLDVSQTTVIEAVEQTFRDAATAAMSKLPLKIERAISFDLLNPRAVEFLQQYEFEMIREITADTTAAIREVMLRSFREGIPPRQAAIEIRSVIGLTSKQAAAVGRFQQALAESTPESIRQALQRELRDHRFDSTLIRALQQETVLSRAQIQQMTQRYYERFLRHRAETIARTETIRAASAGQHELFLQGEQRGLFNRSNVMRRWIVSGDERTCPICMGLNGQKAGLNENFPGGYFYPPAHVMCRCSVSLVFLN